MSSASQNAEKTLSNSNSQIFIRTYRNLDEEVINKINTMRLKISGISDRLEEMVKQNCNPQECTITFPDIKKVIKYKSEEQLEKLKKYLNNISEMKLTIPDFSFSGYLNSIFSRYFGGYIEFHKGLFNKDPDLDEKLRRKIPSRNYEGVYLHDVDIAGNVESIIMFIIFEEFFILSEPSVEELHSENMHIEHYNDESPQQISILNPDFNSITVYISEDSRNMYLLFLTDAVELLGPESTDNFLSRAETMTNKRNPKSRIGRVKTMTNAGSLKVPPKYENLMQTLPDINLQQCEKFIAMIDSDNDDRITPENVKNILVEHLIAIDLEIVDHMFDDVWVRRFVKDESRRKDPIDAKEVFNSIRYKYKRNPDSKEWIPTHRPYRDEWMLVLNLCGIRPPRYALPEVKPKIILTNEEANLATFKPKINKRNKLIKTMEIKPPVFKPPFRPEAGILIQNTPNIEELFIEDPRLQARSMKADKSDAFGRIVNARFGQSDQESDFLTVSLSTKQYYSEALRLSKTPQAYTLAKVNPIERYHPASFDFMYKQIEKEESLAGSVPLGSTQSGTEEESVQNNYGSKRMSPTTTGEHFSMPQSRRSKKYGQQYPTVQTLSSLNGSHRELKLSSSLRPKLQITTNLDSDRPIFKTSFKTHDNKSMRALQRKEDPIVDSYQAPKNYMFRDDSPPYGRPMFKISLKAELPQITENDEKKDYRPKELIDKEERRKFREEEAKLNRYHTEPWIRCFKLPTKEFEMSSGKFPQFIAKGDYIDGIHQVNPIGRSEIDVNTPFKLVHRPLKKTDKSMAFGDMFKSKM